MHTKIKIYTLAIAALLATVSTNMADPIIFSDGFEDATVNGNITTAIPDVGTWLVSGTGDKDSMIILTGSAGAGSPSGAYSGDNYLALTRNNALNYYPTLSAMFLGGNISPAVQDINISFAIWVRDGFASFSLANSTALSPANTLLANAIQSSSKEYRAFTTAWNKIADVATPRSWNLINIAWDASTQSALVSINNGTPFSTPLLGDFSGALDRLFFNTGADGTTFYLDAIQVTIPEPSTVILLILAVATILLTRKRIRRTRL